MLLKKKQNKESYETKGNYYHTRQSRCISKVQYSIDIVTLAAVTSSMLLPSMDYHFYFKYL